MSTAALHRSKTKGVPPPAKPVRFDTLVETGDHLEAQTFLRRYEQYDDGFRAELVEGVKTLEAGLASAEHAAFVRRLTGK